MGSDVLGGFLKGFATGYALMQSKDEREYARAKTEYTKAMAEYYKSGGSRSSNAMRDANYQSQIEARNTNATNNTRRTDAYVESLKNKKGPTEASAVGLDDPDLVGNLDIGESSGDEFYNEASTEAIPEPEPIPEFSHGGVVPKKRRKLMRYANGGAVVQEEDPPIPNIESNEIMKRDREPTVTPVPTRPVAVPAGPNAAPGATGPGMPQTVQPPRPEAIPGAQQPPSPAPGGPGEGMQTPPGIGFSFQAGYDAATAAAEAMMAEHGLDKDEAVPTQDEDKKVAAFANDTKDMASPEQVEQLRQKFDPQKKLSLSQVNMKIAGGVWEAYMKMGDPKKATQAAVALYKNFRANYNQFTQIAQAAAKGGKVDEAIRAILSAYAYVPDGMEVELQKTKDGRFAYRYTDNKTGQVVSRGLKTPEEILSIVTHGAIPSFEELLAQSAGDPAVKAFEDAPSPAAVKGLGLEGGGGPGAGAVGVPTPGPYKNMTEASTVAEHKRRTGPERIDAIMKDNTEQNPFRARTQEELDMLPPGAWVLGPDGVAIQKNQPKPAGK